MDIIKNKRTFVSVISIIGIVIGFPFGLYALANYGSMGGFVVLWCVSGLLILLAIDRALVSFISPRKLSIIEIILTLILVIISLLSS
jgi:hypothetical protein